MPLDKSGSKASVGKNIKTEKAAGTPQKQAVAIALDVQRRAKGKKIHNEKGEDMQDNGNIGGGTQPFGGNGSGMHTSGKMHIMRTSTGMEGKNHSGDRAGEGEMEKAPSGVSSKDTMGGDCMYAKG